jgi:site-specific DNA-methyltransferase (adenine-specific)
MIHTTQTWKIGDCLELMREMPDECVDLFITDPPYGTTDCDFDTSRPINDVYNECCKVLKPNGWMFSFGPIDIFCDIMKSGKWRSKFEYVWIKPMPVPKTHNTIRPAYQHEMLFAFIKKSLSKISDLTYNEGVLSTKGDPYIRDRKKSDSVGTYESSNRIVPIDKNGNKVPYTIINDGIRSPTTLLKANTKQCMKHAERTTHPTQKPLEIIELIIKGYSIEGDLVCDPFLGSGTTLEACRKTNRNCIGFEISDEWEKYYPDRAMSHTPTLQSYMQTGDE